VARAIWSGVISFGLVSVPVGLYTATSEHQPTFHQFQEGTTDRIHYKRVNERTGREVEFDKIVRGADVGDDSYVILSDDDLASVAPGRSRMLEVERFVALDEVDPIYFNKAYYLAPSDETAQKTYALLRDAMAKSGRAAIGSFVMHGKEHLAALRASGEVMILSTLFFADEVRDAKKQLDKLPGKPSFKGQEMQMATQLIESMTGPWKPGDYRDSYTDRINKLIKAKSKDKSVRLADEAPEPTNVTDLMEALRASVDAAKGRSKPAKSAKPAKAAKPAKSAARRKKAS
jgi:DNA end-binding protein Ku